MISPIASVATVKKMRTSRIAGTATTSAMPPAISAEAARSAIKPVP